MTDNPEVVWIDKTLWALERLEPKDWRECETEGCESLAVVALSPVGGPPRRWLCECCLDLLRD